jgi:hypothetical protein
MRNLVSHIKAITHIENFQCSAEENIGKQTLEITKYCKKGTMKSSS